MGYTTVFGGELLFPSQLSYLAISTGVDIDLQWPTEQQITGGNVVADFLDISTSAINVNVDMPDARNTSEGNKTTVNNIGGNDFNMRDATGGIIQQIEDGDQWVIVLTDNSTEAGIWSAFQLGAATTFASASALAGAGLQADGFGLLELIIASDEEMTTPITVVDGDRAKCLIYTGGAGVTDLPGAGAVGPNWFFMLRNSGSGTLAVTPPSGTIDGSSSINLDPNDSAFIFTDGVDYFTIGLSTGSTIAFDFVSLPIPGSGDFVLSGANLNRISYRFTGALTGNRKVVVPDTTQQYWCDNQTTGAFILTIGTAAQGMPPELNPNTTSIVYSNSIEVIDAVSQVSVMFPIMVSEGGTGATTASLAMDNLGVGRDVLTPALGGLDGGGDLGSDLSLLLDTDNLTLDLAVDKAADTFAYFDDSLMVMRKATLDVLGITIGGTPVDNEIAVFTGPNAIEGDSNFRWTGTAFQIEGTGIFEIRVGTVTTFDLNGMTELNIRGMDEADDGLVLEDGMRLTFEDQAFANQIFMRNEGIGGGSGTISVRKAGGTATFELREGIGLALRDGADTLVATFGTLTGPPSVLNLSGTFDGLRIQLGSLYIFEQGVASASQAQSGQIWVRDDVANMLMFTDDTGIDMVVPATQFINKDLDETLNNSSAYQDDNEMVGFQMDQDAIYRIRIAVNVLQVSAAAGFKMRIIGEGAGTIIGSQFGMYSISESTGVLNGDQQAGAQGQVTNTVGDNYVVLEGIAQIGNPDTFKVQWAQVVATASNTIVENESYVEITKIVGS